MSLPPALLATALLLAAITGEAAEEGSTPAGLVTSSAPVRRQAAVRRQDAGSGQDAVVIGAPDTAGQAEEISGRAGRRLKRLRRIALPLLLVLLLVKTGLGMPLLMSGVALAAFKGLWTGTTALLVTAALALRHLIPAPRVIIAGGGGGGHHHYTDYVADYRRADDYRDDYNRYSGGWR